MSGEAAARMLFDMRRASVSVRRRGPGPRPARAVLTTILVGILTGVFQGCGPGWHEETAPGVLVIAVDGLRADRLGVMGYDRPTTPVVDALAGEGISFAQAFAAAPEAPPSHMALLTGCDPILGQRLSTGDPSTGEPEAAPGWRIPEGLPQLAVEMLFAGYRTAAFLDTQPVEAVQGRLGFQSVFELGDEQRIPGETPVPLRHVLSWVRSLERDEPWFAYVQLADLERSWALPDSEAVEYFPSRRGRGRVPPVGNMDAVFFALPNSRWRGASRSLGQYESAYDGHLRALDAELGELFDHLRRIDRFDATSVTVLGTHGLQFGEAGLYLRSGRTSMADLHVPWVLRPREGATDLVRGTTVENLASLTDLAPTLLDLEGLPVPPAMEGVSQVSALREGGTGPRSVAFAACAMQEGFCAIGPRHAYEVLLLGRIEAPSAYRAWLGEGPDAGAPGSKATTIEARFYDRIATPYPPLSDVLAAPPKDPAFRELRAASTRWIEDAERARAELFPSPVAASWIGEETRRELADRGLLEDAPR